MVCKGNAELPVNCDRWPIAKTIVVLGHVLQNDGGIGADWKVTCAKMWGVFWKCVVHGQTTRVQQRETMRSLQQCVFACAQWKLSRWPFQETVAVKMDHMQAEMMRCIIRTPILDGETNEHFFRRRARIARDTAARAGNWSKKWASRVLAWDKHINKSPLCVQQIHHCKYIIEYHDSTWLLFKRAAFTNESGRTLAAGLTGTRSVSGRPQMRWQDGVSLASTIDSSRQTTLFGNHALGISSIAREAVVTMRSVINGGV